MRLLVLLLLCSCSATPFYTNRCFDALELNGKVNFVVIERGREIFYCGDKGDEYVKRTEHND